MSNQAKTYHILTYKQISEDKRILKTVKAIKKYDNDGVIIEWSEY